MNIARSLAFVALVAGSALVYAATNGVTGIQAAQGCEVCHNGKHPHTVIMPCDKVTKYLQNHPGDYAGQCQNVSSEKPPKPTPTPKPPKPPRPVAPTENQSQ